MSRHTVQSSDIPPILTTDNESSHLYEGVFATTFEIKYINCDKGRISFKEAVCNHC